MKRLLRKALRIAIIAFLGWVLLVAALGIFWRWVPPVSTLMLGRWLTGQPVERTFVDLDEVSPYMIAAVVNSEDARFCQHRGVDWGMLQQVIVDDDGPSRGASTISMQTAKNLFLWPSRSYVRKGLELPVALYLDGIWPKRRMLEVYLNIAEWGEGIFGVEAAAQRYFRKKAQQLTLREAALLATALPNPRWRNPARPNQHHQALATNLADRMEQAGMVHRCVLGND